MAHSPEICNLDVLIQKKFIENLLRLSAKIAIANYLNSLQRYYACEIVLKFLKINPYFGQLLPFNPSQISFYYLKK